MDGPALIKDIPLRLEGCQHQLIRDQRKLGLKVIHHDDARDRLTVG